jgi:hypothetical protein
MQEDSQAGFAKEAMEMARAPDVPHVDMQRVTDDMAGIYEAVATLEYAGREPTRRAIAAATELPGSTLDQNLAAMSRLGMLVSETRAGRTVYRPSRRGWSTQPGQAEGPKLS